MNKGLEVGKGGERRGDHRCWLQNKQGSALGRGGGMQVLGRAGGGRKLPAGR